MESQPSSSVLFPCPSRETLRRFLEESDPENVQGDVARHVDACPRCQAELDTILSGMQDVTFTDVPEDERPADSHPSVAQLVRRLKDVPIESTPTADQSPSIGCPVRFPDPPLDGAPLGAIGPYLIQHYLGSGGTGHLFRAEDTRLSRTVAVKVLKNELAALEIPRARFEREARTVAQLDSPHIVRIHEVGAPEDFPPYLVMEYVEGESLDHRIRTRGPHSAEVSARILIQILDALNDAHAQGVVHRDVKPSNVLIDESSSRVKLADFGLARLDNPRIELTSEGTLAGTPAYMSPEQVREPNAVDARSDVYSAGIILFELLTGDVPFRGVLRMVLQRVLHEEPRPPRQLNDQIPRDIQNICLKAIHKEPSRRYASAAEFRDDLQRWLNHEPVVARPVSSTERLWRWSRRNPVIASLSVLVAVLVVAVGTVWGWMTMSLADSNRTLEDRNLDLRRIGFQRNLALDDARRGQASAVAGMRVAEDQVNDAFDFVDDMLAAINELPESGHSVQKLKQELLGKIIARLQDMDSSVQDADRVHLGRAVAENRLGDVFAGLGHLKEAEDSYRRAEDVMSRLLDADPGDVAIRQSLINTSLDLGDLLSRNGRPDDARTRYTTAARLTERPAAGAQSDPAIQRHDLHQRAVAHERLGRLAVAEADAIEAIGAFQQSVDALDLLMAQSPDANEGQHDLVSVLRQLGEALRTVDTVQALAAYERAIDVSSRLVDDTTDNATLTRSLALSYFRVAELTSDADRRRSSARRCIELFGDAARLPDEDREATLAVAISHSLIGALAHGAGQASAAQNELAESVRLMERCRLQESANADELHAWFAANLNLAIVERAAGEADRADKRLRDISRQLTAMGDRADDGRIVEIRETLDRLLSQPTNEPAASSRIGRSPGHSPDLRLNVGFDSRFPIDIVTNCGFGAPLSRRPVDFMG